MGIKKIGKGHEVEPFSRPRIQTTIITRIIPTRKLVPILILLSSTFNTSILFIFFFMIAQMKLPLRGLAGF